MKVSRKVLLTLTGGLLCAVVPAGAQQQGPLRTGPPQAQRKAPLQWPNLEGRRLAFLLGVWEEKVSYAAASGEEKSEEGTGRWFARPALGRYIQFNYEGSGPLGNYRALGMLTFDRDALSFRMWWFDSEGGVGDYRGNFVDENTLTLEHRGKTEGRDFRERISYTRVSPMQVRTKIEQAWDSGEYKVYLEAVATRIGDRPPTGPGAVPQPQRPPGE